MQKNPILDGDIASSSLIIQRYSSYPFFLFLQEDKNCLVNVHKEFCWNFAGDFVEYVD